MTEQSSHHDEITECAGDDWAIICTLLDIDGTPLDLTDAGLLWTLIGPDGKLAIPNNSGKTEQNSNR